VDNLVVSIGSWRLPYLNCPTICLIAKGVNRFDKDFSANYLFSLNSLLARLLLYYSLLTVNSKVLLILDPGQFLSSKRMIED
jgi:hypothetical protein